MVFLSFNLSQPLPEAGSHSSLPSQELVASKTPFPAVILNEVKDLLQQNEEILRYAQNDIWELTHYEFQVNLNLSSAPSLTISPSI